MAVNITPRSSGETPAHERGFTPFADLQNEMNSLFDSFTRTFGLPAWHRGWEGPVRAEEAHPATAVADVRFEVSEADDAYKITAEVPGLTEKDVDVEVSGDFLTVKGEKSHEQERTEETHYVRERSYGSFRRSFRLPEDVDRDNIEATVDKGVLTLKLPKTPEAQRQVKKVTVKQGG
ncbi:heat shock protein Hsp20 [Limimonas halophila]|uniref:Heat shock protein Hsp20 n=1 Tax=Limimonas halophila TaxID=1082479 RepID=A0A1G7QMJ5_9PROT|nr:Hsp20/alpha crystallin family protein [Limimonas halophila]SDF99767.1 heat shock protein Hsp20 [Limimonas halophila]